MNNVQTYLKLQVNAPQNGFDPILHPCQPMQYVSIFIAPRPNSITYLNTHLKNT